MWNGNGQREELEREGNPLQAEEAPEQNKFIDHISGARPLGVEDMFFLFIFTKILIKT